jgi:hypothetical protein
MKDVMFLLSLDGIFRQGARAGGFFAVLGGVSVFAEDNDPEYVPRAFPEERYQDTLKMSPFVLATPPAEPPKVEEAPFTQNLYLGGIATLATGEEYVIVKRVGGDSFRLIGLKAPNEEGISVDRIAWAPENRRTKVILRLGDKTGEIGYNETELHGGGSAPPAPSGQSPQNSRPPGSLRPGSGTVPRPGTPAFGQRPTPTTPARPVTPGAPVPANQPRPTTPGVNPIVPTITSPITTAKQPVAAPNSGAPLPDPNTRRRIRVISPAN